MNPSYVANNVDDLFDAAPGEIQDLIADGEVNTSTAILGKLYKLPVSQYTKLSDLITYLLIGAIVPDNALTAIKDMLGLSEEDATRLAQDLEKTILEKARIKILGKAPTDMVTLEFKEGRSPEELRTEILDTTKRGPLAPPQTPVEPLPEAPTAAVAAPVPVVESAKVGSLAGSRSQLLEQLKILDDIPNDDEIAERLKKIQEQITGMDKESERNLESTIALSEFMPKGDEAAVSATEKAATYSRAPTKYNVDPYREVAGE
jgi:hypothetical protein